MNWVLPGTLHIINTMSKAMDVYHLTDGWTFKQADGSGEKAWLPVKRVPTNVHLDLIDNGMYVIS